MATWLDDANTPDDIQDNNVLKTTDLGREIQPIKKEAGLFSGALTSPVRGAAIGLNKIGNSISAPIDAVADRSTQRGGR